MILTVVQDVETAERVGASGTFQITELTMQNTSGDSVDISSLVDQGIHFHSVADLRTYLAGVLGTPAEHINISVVEQIS